MKIIKVSDEMYNSLMELSDAINTQDNRCTAMPYFYQIRTKEIIAVPEGNGTEAWHNDSSTIETEEEIKDAVFEYKEWNEENQDYYDGLDGGDIEEILRSAGWNKVYYDIIEKYQNSFFTEKACKEHIRLNKYHYKEPVDYLSYAFRNPEMELLLKFLCELSGGKLHK